MRVLRSVLGGCVFVVACVVVLTTITSTPPAGPAIHSIVSHNLKVSYRMYDFVVMFAICRMKSYVNILKAKPLWCIN